MLGRIYDFGQMGHMFCWNTSLLIHVSYSWWHKWCCGNYNTRDVLAGDYAASIHHWQVSLIELSHVVYSFLTEIRSEEKGNKIVQ